jgi:flagellar hook-length control protein FliK
MTNQTNLDYLFKLTRSVPERGAGGSTSSNERRPAFDDHLVNASASTSDSLSATSARLMPTESTPPESEVPASRRRPDDGYSAPRSATERAENSTPVDAAADSLASNDADDAASEEDSATDQDAADVLAAAAVIDEQAAQTSQDATLEEEHLDDGDAVAIASKSPGKLSAARLTSASSAAGDVASNVEIDLGAQAQSLDTSKPQRSRNPANATHSAHATATDDNNQRESARERSGANATAVDGASALANNAAAGAKTKPAKAIAAGRRGAIQSIESAQERRAPASDATNRADANGSQNVSAATAVANVINPQIATAGTGEASDEASRAIKPIGQNAEGIHLTTRAQRSGAAGRRRAHAAQAPDLPRVDAARFVGRVAKAVQTAQDRGGMVQLRLSPPELGSLRLELSMQNGIMTAAVETETPAARQVLLDHLPALRERLAEQNIRIERFDVDVRQENSGGQADPRAQQEQRQHQPQQPNSRHAAGRAAATQPPTGEAQHLQTRLTNSELNLLA